MAVYTTLTNEEIAELVGVRYALGELAFAVGIAQGVENSNYLVTVRAPHGEETRYILTLFEKRVNTQELPFFIDLMAHLASNGVVCPRPLRMCDGSTHGIIKGKAFVMVSFLEGKSISLISPEQCGEVGNMIAKLHAASAGFVPTRANNVAIDAWRSLAASMGKTLNTLHAGLFDMVQNELAYLNAHWPTQLPSGVVHADIFPDNVFFDDDGACCGVIDFYFACNDMFAYDLMIAMNAWCFEENGELNLLKSRALLKAYQAARPLSQPEIQALPVLARGAALRFLLTRAYDALHAPKGALLTIKDPLEYARKLTVHQQIQTADGYGV